MSRIVGRRVCAEMDGGFVVFLIGMRVNKPWKFWKWLPVATAMPRMLIELAKQPELGLLHAENQFSFPNVTVTQYWKSFEALEAYAKARDHAHLPAWQAFNKAVASNGEASESRRMAARAPGVQNIVVRPSDLLQLKRASVFDANLPRGRATDFHLRWHEKTVRLRSPGAIDASQLYAPI